MIYYLYVVYLMIFGLFMFFMSLYFLINKFTYFLELEILKISSIKIEYLILLDWASIMFISVVMLISSMIMSYSIEYMKHELFINRFMYMLILFMISMMLMIISPNLISILMGWDGLGLVSYCLVIYYQNENSYNSGMVTVLTNRIGDIIILMMIGLMLSSGSWNFMFLNNLNTYLLFMLMVVSITKSAQIPFSSWLPMAMAAPTPVSSLVHSSTLVTAGVYLLIRFNYLMTNVNLLNLMMLISILTMLMSGIAANLENDLKKIIAFSTLSQLGVMIFCLSLKLSDISFFHLLTHAMFKSMLFMCAGVIIHNMLGNQDIRYISMIMINMPVISMMFLCSSLSLCGMPFLSGFFSKDLILEMFLMSFFNKFIFIMLFFSMGLTVSYTYRLLYYSFFKIPNINYYNRYDSLESVMMQSMIFLFLMSIIMGVSMSWLLFSMKNYIYLTKGFKLIIYLFMILGFLTGVFISVYKIKKINMFNLNLYKKFFTMMWFLSLIYNLKLSIILILSQKFNFNMDFGWNEYLFGVNFYFFMKKLFELDFYNKNYFYLLIFIIYFVLVILLLI